MKSLYPSWDILSKLNAHLQPFFQGFTRPTRRSLIWIVIAILAVGAVHSVRDLHTEFLGELGLMSLSAAYYALSHARRPVKGLFAMLLAKLALGVVPDALKNAPCFLIIDDTLVPKFGKKFDHVGVLFDHAAHDGRPYKNGHYFVCIVLAVPVGIDPSTKQVRYLCIPLLLRMWVKGGPSKLEIAHDLLVELRDSIGAPGSFTLLTDSWYPKAPLLRILSEWKGLGFVGAVRSDTALFDLPPAHTGKRGRPRKRGDRLTLQDFTLKPCGMKDYLAGRRAVLTKLFGDTQVTAFVTCPVRGGQHRLYLSTMTSHEVRRLLDSELPFCETEHGEFVPLLLYRNRWAVEVSFFELKSFWSLENYMVRHASGIDMLLNLIVLTYSLAKLLPWIDPDFAAWQGQSAQEIRRRLGRLIWGRVFLYRLVRALQTENNPSRLEKAFARRLRSYSKLL